MSAAFTWILRHPRLTAWGVLSLGMFVILANEARHLDLLLGNWIALLILTILTAAGCVWIISWEEVDEHPQVENRPAPPSSSDES